MTLGVGGNLLISIIIFNGINERWALIKEKKSFDKLLCYRYESEQVWMTKLDLKTIFSMCLCGLSLIVDLNLIGAVITPTIG